MSTYHQMGHDSENLLAEPQLSALRGAILSPVNYTEADVTAQIAVELGQRSFEWILDPQLYYPNSRRGKLREWSYFPNDVDTADLTSEAWWRSLCADVATVARRLGVTAVCSPAMVPRLFDDVYYRNCVAATADLRDALTGDVGVFQTVVVALNDLAVSDRVLSIASIVTGGTTDQVYLVPISGLEPRRELYDVEALKGAMRLISLLRDAGISVTVGFCSTDMVLWKHAGAANCASGKYFNLRRFTQGRFEEPSGGGGQLPYWVEESLLAFLRESDLLRVERAGLLSDASTRNPFSQEVLQRLSASPPAPWLGKSWRHYLWWFADCERRIEAGEYIVDQGLREAEEMWTRIENLILMEERANSGAWLRSWRRACIEFRNG